MNARVSQSFAEYLLDAKARVPAAMLTLANTLRQSTAEPIIAETDDEGTVGVKEAAELLRISSKKIYFACLAGKQAAAASEAGSASPSTRSSTAKKSHSPQPWSRESPNERRRQFSLRRMP